MKNVLIALTQLFCQVWFGLIKGEKTYPDESTSAFVFRTKKWRWVKWVNWLFDDPNHCRDAYEHEKDGSQNAPDYGAKFNDESA